MSPTTKIYRVGEKITNPHCTSLHQTKRFNTSYKYRKIKTKNLI